MPKSQGRIFSWLQYFPYIPARNFLQKVCKKNSAEICSYFGLKIFDYFYLQKSTDKILPNSSVRYNFSADTKLLQIFCRKFLAAIYPGTSKGCYRHPFECTALYKLLPKPYFLKIIRETWLDPRHSLGGFHASHGCQL